MYVGKTPEHETQVAGVRLPAGSSRADYEAKLAQARRDGSGETVYPAEEVCSREVMRTAGRGRVRALAQPWLSRGSQGACRAGDAASPRRVFHASTQPAVSLSQAVIEERAPGGAGELPSQTWDDWDDPLDVARR